MYTAKRGMIFWFDSSRRKDEDKNNATIVDYNGNEKKTGFLSGRRPHVVVSCDDINANGNVCTIVPVKSHVDNVAYNYSADVIINGRTSTADVRYISSIDQREIDPHDFIGFLSDSCLENIDRCLVKYLIKTTEKPKPSKHTIFMGVDIGSDIVDESKEPEKVVVESGVNLEKPKLNKKKKSGSQNRWGLKEARQLMEDYENNSIDFVMAKYGFTSKQSVYSTKYALTKKFGERLMTK